MQKTRRVLRNLNVINILLVGTLFLFLNYAVLPMFGKKAKISLPAPKKQTTAHAPALEKPGETKTASPADYIVIAEQNLFHPERKIPVEKKDLAAPPPPKPEFVLYGILLTDDLQIAYMEDMKAPQNAPTRGKKQIPVRPGEVLSGFVLKEIGTDKVVMVRGDEKIDVFLNDTARPKTRDASPGLPVAQHAPAARAPQPPLAASSTQPAGNAPVSQPVGAAPQRGGLFRPRR